MQTSPDQLILVVAFLESQVNEELGKYFRHLCSAIKLAHEELVPKSTAFIEVPKSDVSSPSKDDLTSLSLAPSDVKAGDSSRPSKLSFLFMRKKNQIRRAEENKHSKPKP